MSDMIAKHSWRKQHNT